jgi:tetratricopeptide (TPR) repeat protein
VETTVVNSKMQTADQQLFNRAFKELIHAYSVSSWRGESLANKGVLAIEMNKLTDAEKSFINAIKIDPYFETAYINLADIYRSQQRPFQANAVLLKGVKNNPKSAALHYSYGLYFVRQKDIIKAIEYLEKSMVLMPDNPQFAYTYVLALDGAGKSKQALEQLKVLIVNYQNKTQLKELGLYLSQKLKLRSEYNWFMGL